MKKLIRVGSRDSQLAVMQTKLVMDLMKKNHKELQLELVTLKTTGDKILDRTLDKIGGKGLFVKELDQALLDGRIDVAIHSLKDVPMEVSEEIPLVAYVKRGDPRDALVLPRGKTASPIEEKIGSSSARRILQLKHIYPNMHAQSVRGNIMTRLRKLDDGQYSSLVLACAGLIRAGLEDRISRYFSTSEMLPAAGQGILAVQARHDLDTFFLENIDDTITRYQAIAERSYVRTLDGGCSSPIAAYADVKGNDLKLTGLYYKEGEDDYRIASIVGEAGKGEKLGEELAKQLAK